MFKSTAFIWNIIFCIVLNITNDRLKCTNSKSIAALLQIMFFTLIFKYVMFKCVYKCVFESRIQRQAPTHTVYSIIRHTQGGIYRFNHTGVDRSWDTHTHTHTHTPTHTVYSIIRHTQGGIYRFNHTGVDRSWDTHTHTHTYTRAHRAVAGRLSRITRAG